MKTQCKKLASLLLCVCLLLSVMAVNVFAGTESTYVYQEVTEAPADWSGEYLIVYKAKGYVFDSSMASPDVSGNHFTVAITDGKIEANATTNAAKVTIAKSGDGYSIKMASGKYVGHSGSKNTLNTGTTPYVHTLSYASGSVKAACGDYSLLFNSNTGSGNNRFRYYKTNQQPINLYKLVEVVNEEEEPEQEPNTAVVDEDTRIITVKADEGYQLKAGALVVTDKNGKRHVPTRVGYRESDDSTKYEIPAEAGDDFTLPSNEELFYQPAGNTGEKDNNINVAYLGAQTTDVNTYGGGMRHVHRLNISADGDKRYLLYNGVKQEVTEYGLLLAAQAVLKNPEDLDIETAKDSMHVQRYEWPKENKYFDQCSDYVDLSVHVTGILTAGGGDVNIITRTYVILEDATVYYGEFAVDNYNEVNAR